MRNQVAAALSESADIWSDYVAIMLSEAHESDDTVENIARRLIDTGVSYSEFDACHIALMQKHTKAGRRRQNANAVRRQVLGVYDNAFEDYRKLEKKYRREIFDKRKDAEVMSTEKKVIAASRDNLRSEVAVQSRMLAERAKDLEAMNGTLVAQRDELAGFLYSVSHDLKSPMNTVSSLLTFFLEDNTDVDCDLSDIEDALATAKRTLVMLNDLFNFSRALDAPARKEDVDLDRMVSEIFRDLAGDAQDRKPDFVKDSLPVVTGSEFQLRLLFQNLISNGAKFCPEDRTPRVEVKNKGLRGITHAAIAVADNGIGIPPEFHQRIFGLFNRLHTYTDYPGTGIGLALCDRILRNHGGQIDVRSDAGQGATFVVVLPL